MNSKMIMRTGSEAFLYNNEIANEIFGNLYLPDPGRHAVPHCFPIEILVSGMAKFRVSSLSRYESELFTFRCTIKCLLTINSLRLKR
mgnify:CR=1 FL=1